MTVELEVFGTCMDCEEHSSAFPEVARRLANGRCETCGSDAIANARTVPPTSWGEILDGRYLRGQRWTGAA